MQRNLLIVPLLAVAVMMVTAGCTPGPGTNATGTPTETLAPTDAPTETEAPAETGSSETDTPEATETETPTMEETETPGANETETPTETPVGETPA